MQAPWQVLGAVAQGLAQAVGRVHNLHIHPDRAARPQVCTASAAFEKMREVEISPDGKSLAGVMPRIVGWGWTNEVLLPIVLCLSYLTGIDCGTRK